MSEPLYNHAILRLASEIPHLTRLPEPGGSVTKRSPICGSEVAADVVLDGASRVAAFGLGVRACALGQASAALLGAHVIGRTAAELAAARDAFAGYLNGGADPDWPGLTLFQAARAHRARHASMLLRLTRRRARRRWRRSMSMRRSEALILLLLAAPAAAQTPEAAVSEGELRNTVATLVGFGTRATGSDTQSPTRGIGAARRWAEARLRAYGAACGGCLEVSTPATTVTGKRLPKPTQVVDVLAVQRGVSDPNRVIVISGHIDSRNSGDLDSVGDAPGANDDGSGTAAVLEAARVLSGHKFPATIVYAVLSGEEQGLYGGELLAGTAKAQRWQVEAVLNNDIVGNTTGTNGARDADHVRVFSEGTRSVETPDEGVARRYNGGEVDSPARNLSRFIAGLNVPGLTVTQVYRTDRYGRGGDQVPMLAAGYPAVRVTEAVENYDRQHQNVRFENGRAYGDVLAGVDFAYLAKVTRLNVAALAALAAAPAPPLAVTIKGAVSSNTTLAWKPVPGAATYRVWWRATVDPQWRYSRDAGAATALTLPGVVIDDWLFGVSAVSADGHASPVEFPGPAGAFAGAQ